MRRLVGFFLAGAVLAPGLAGAQVQPHRAEYALRLGMAANAPRIGTAVHDLSLDCSGWHLKRDIKTEIALTASWKMSLASKLDGQEPKSGNAFRFSTVQVQNGSEREFKGRVQRQGGELKAEIVQAGAPPNQFVLPPPTLMPVAAIDHLIERLRANAASFPALMFDAEVMGDAFLIEVTEQQRSQLRAARPADKPVAAPAGQVLAGVHDLYARPPAGHAAAVQRRRPGVRQRRARPADRRDRPGHRHRRPAGPGDAAAPELPEVLAGARPPGSLERSAQTRIERSGAGRARSASRARS